MLKTFASFIAFATAVSFLPVATAAPRPLVEQKLDSRASQIKFKVKSPSATFDGSFSDISGKLNLDQSDVTKSNVQLALNVESVKLPPDQFFPALLVQSVIQRLKSKVATFRSTSFTSRGKNFYDVDGFFSWQGKEKPTSVPIEVISSTPSLTKIRCVIKGGLDPSASPLAGALGGRGNGEALSQLVFVRR